MLNTKPFLLTWHTFFFRPIPPRTTEPITRIDYLWDDYFKALMSMHALSAIREPHKSALGYLQ